MSLDGEPMGHLLCFGEAATGAEAIAQGLSNNDIAAQLHISGKTVSNHISNIFNKLQVADRAQAVVRAIESGLGH